MAFYAQADINKVRDAAAIADFIPGEITRKYGKSFGTCPECGGDKLQITDNSKYRNIHCFKCGFHKDGVFSVIMHIQNLTYPEAVKYAADRYYIDIKTEQEHRKDIVQEKQKSIEESFCMEQLRGSGLTLEDVTARVKSDDGKDWIFRPLFTPGSMDYSGKVEPEADDMLIHYYTLYGSPMKVQVRGMKNYIRARWSIPDSHKGKDGRPAKYGTIKGADARFYFPGKIIQAFQDKKQFDTLIIQEGEKKAEKACKHGIPSIAIQGIFNIGNRDTGLINDLQYLVKQCGIRKIALLFDSDWDHLSDKLEPGDAIDLRPTMFARAAIKFREYVDTLNSVGLNVDIWFGHINENEADDKGIDDLLCNTLKGKEELLATDIENAMRSVQGVGEYVTMHRISVMSDINIMNFWDLRDKDVFFKRHADRIRGLGRFKFAKIFYVEKGDGTIERSSVSGSEKEFWSTEFDPEKKKSSYKFDTMECLNFLSSNGYHLYKSSALGKGNLGFIHVEKSVAQEVFDYDIRRFVFEFVLTNSKDRGLHNFFLEGLPQFLGKSRMENLKIFDMKQFYEADMQFRFYLGSQLRITADDIESGPISTVIWEQNLIGRNFRRVQVIRELVKQPNGSFRVYTTPEGEQCEFLQFLVNTSNEYCYKQEELTSGETDSVYTNLANKITSIGYLLSDYRYPDDEKVVIAMDSTMSEVGKSNGRSGKSMIGKAISHITEQAFVDGKAADNSDDFLFSDITPQSRNVFFDDVKPHFNFTRLFSAVTGPLAVNPKLGSRFVIPYEEVPKFYITTNHAIDDDSPSAKDRMSLMMFSPYYNIDHKPFDDFGHAFFSQWDEWQWTLFDNLMAECVMFYLRARREKWNPHGSGIIPPPSRSADMRQLRQKMGEPFLAWAEIYFSDDGTAINQRIVAKNMMESFFEECPGQRRFVTTQGFRERLEAFCRYSGLHFNPHRPEKKSKLQFSEWRLSGNGGSSFIGDRDNSGGKIYYTVATDDYSQISKF